MEIALLVYDGIAPLDAVGPYEVLRNVPGWEVKVVSSRRGEARSENGSLALVADHELADVAAPDMVLVPGGSGSRRLLRDEPTLEWLRAADRETRWTASVCTGALVLGAAGLLEGKRATTNWQALELLGQFGAEAVGGRYVVDGKLATAAGVTAGIDMALHLVALEASPEIAQAVQLGIEYDPDPPFDTGHPSKAPAEIVELVLAAERAKAPSP